MPHFSLPCFLQESEEFFGKRFKTLQYLCWELSLLTAEIPADSAYRALDIIRPRVLEEPLHKSIFV